MENSIMKPTRWLTPFLLSGVALSGCGGGDADFSAPSFEVGGTVSGLSSATALELTLASGDSVTISQDGSFRFPRDLALGGSYAVSVAQQPTGQTCTVSSGSGSSVNAAVTSIAVDCVTHTYPVSGTVSGLTSGSVQLSAANPANAVTVSQNGAFQLPMALPFGSNYAVTVTQQPPGQTCTVSGGTGNDISAAVTGITVSCAPNIYTVSGTVSGLPSGTQLTLNNNGGDAVIVAADGTFAFPTRVAAYEVSVATQPSGATCTVGNGTGTASADVSDITVSCVPNGYTVSGTVSGLTSGAQLTLNNNGGDALVVAANGSFTFPTLASAYAVTVASQPSSTLFCSVSNGSGTASANVSNVSVSCVASVALNCGTGKLLNGIEGRKGGIIDQIRIRCADVIGGSLDTTTTAAGDSAGGGGGSSFGPFTCPAGEWITGVSGGNGSGSFPTAMASVRATCSGGSQSPSYNSGGNFAFSFNCPAGQKAKGLQIGAVGGYTGFMQGIICE
ncbi:DUF4369 domain-containing protein [Sphaerotilus natans]|uniref:DUF4369 domain-containing protein n=1 Tax=Sphaerotilus natans TaxID=34103 RepID=UPI00406C774F